ncbi:hypothetical protein LOZ80_25975 [Paenibacillus sp. HWE-109]|uniref:hypothetical protein n=1 Tax=Paenibacillus sp. HWE-109 TaxID=1306526 RepID=UPI001EDF410F|nr:hypothetical protein [Paenibacillus sp. HWE-109]UKS25029.1 hypothetical protein LOZ80_25975 [Paenibacillus sp. HWE-109]
MEDIANHSESALQVSETPIETSTQTEQANTPAATQEAPKGLTVKYNKEDRFIPEEEAPTWIQKGLNYDKVAERAKEAETYQQNLERIAKHYGFDSHNDYMKALDEHEHQLKIQEEAAKLGVDESVIRDHLEPMKKQIAQFEQEKEALRQERLQVQINSDIADLKARFPDFEQHQEKVFDLAISKGYRLEDAYKLATYEDKISNIAKQTEAETLRKIQQNRETATGSLGAGGVEHKTGFAAMSKEDQLRMIEEVKQGKRTSFD